MRNSQPPQVRLVRPQCVENVLEIRSHSPPRVYQTITCLGACRREVRDCARGDPEACQRVAKRQTGFPVLGDAGIAGADGRASVPDLEGGDAPAEAGRVPKIEHLLRRKLTERLSWRALLRPILVPFFAAAIDSNHKCRKDQATTPNQFCLPAAARTL
jgi:hypothetical protein